jgi:hypothetical protein
VRTSILVTTRFARRARHERASTLLRRPDVGRSREPRREHRIR